MVIFGFRGYKNVIDEIEKTNNTIFLKNEFKAFIPKQEPEELEDYVVKNLKQIGTFENFRLFAK